MRRHPPGSDDRRCHEVHRRTLAQGLARLVAGEGAQRQPERRPGLQQLTILANPQPVGRALRVELGEARRAHRPQDLDLLAAEAAQVGNLWAQRQGIECPHLHLAARLEGGGGQRERQRAGVELGGVERNAEPHRLPGRLDFPFERASLGAAAHRQALVLGFEMAVQLGYRRVRGVPHLPPDSQAGRGVEQTQPQVAGETGGDADPPVARLRLDGGVKDTDWVVAGVYPQKAFAQPRYGSREPRPEVGLEPAVLTPPQPPPRPDESRDHHRRT